MHPETKTSAENNQIGRLDTIWVSDFLKEVFFFGKSNSKTRFLLKLTAKPGIVSALFFVGVKPGHKLSEVSIE